MESLSTLTGDVALCLTEEDLQYHINCLEQVGQQLSVGSSEVQPVETQQTLVRKKNETFRHIKT
jgi:hypothetical protein